MQHIMDIFTNFPYLGIFVLLMLGGLGLPFPEDATLILCGFLVSEEVIHLAPALVIVYPGLLLADFILYSMGRKYGRMVVTHRWFHHILTPERLDKAEELFKRRGILVILFGRHFAGLRAQIFLVAGITRMPRWEFILADAFTSIFTIAVMVGIGYKGGESYEVLRKDISHIEHIAMLAAAAGIAAYLTYRSILYWWGKEKK